MAISRFTMRVDSKKYILHFNKTPEGFTARKVQLSLT